VGGAISTNGLGYLGSGYGSMGDQVLGLEAVTPTGDVLRTKPLPQASTGADFTHLFIGAEGVFGIMTEVTLRAHPLPEERRLYAIHFPNFPAGFRAVCGMFSVGLAPAMVDMGEEGGPHIASEGDFPTTLFMALDGFRESVDAQETRALALSRDQGGHPLKSPDAESYWQTRHRSADRYLEARAKGQRHPWSRNRQRQGSFDYLHTALPISRVLEYRQRALRIFEEHGMEVHECAIWGPPELFSLLVADPTATTEEDFQRARAASDTAIRLAQDMGGNMEHVHGVGLRLVHLLERELGLGGMAVARRLKAALDPARIMNPGKLYG
jgi:D-lactate dehydrogenase (cytochrome)